MSNNQPPLVKGLPLIGSALDALGTDPRDFLLYQVKVHGPIFRLKAMHINYIVMAGASANNFVNKEGRGYFESRTFWKGMMHELEADNFLIGLDGEDHKMLRKLFAGNFSRTNVDLHLNSINDLCIKMFSDVKLGVEFEVVDRVLQLTSQIIGCVMTGKVPNRQELDYFLYYINEITNHFTLRRLPAWMLKFKQGKFKKAKALTLSFAEEVVNEHLVGSSGLHNFVDTVIEASNKCPHLFNKGDIRFSAILPLFAGIDTLGQTINYALFELHRNPAILKELQNEIDGVYSQGVPSTDKLKTMDVLNRVIKETLRLHPAAFGMVRTANRDFEFEGCRVSKGDDVVVLTTASHFSDSYFKNPFVFDIDRYLPPRNEHRQADVYAPFGRGPHICLGAGMSESIMGLVLGSILYNFKFKHLNPSTVYKERINPTPSLGKQFKLTLGEKRIKS